MRDKARSERGAAAFMLAISLFLLIGASAIAVDIAAIWLDRSADQKVTDSAAAAGALEAILENPASACETALNYVAVNSNEIGSIDTTPCASAFPGACSAGDTLAVDSGRYRITVTHPVTNADDLMTSGIIGGSPQTLHDDDGDECERVAVEMRSTRKSLFAQVLGFGQGTTTVHTVATATTGEGRPPINLLVLDRHGCEAITVRGGGGIIVDAVIDVDDMGNPIGLAPGLIAADSDGTSPSCGSEGVINVEGSGSLLRADGPETCPSASGNHLVGPYTAIEGCGKIQVHAPGTPGCGPLGANLPACSPGPGNPPKPEPTGLSTPYTREKADHRWNCYSNYDWGSWPDVDWATDPLTLGNEQNIEPCEEPDPPHIYNLILAMEVSGTPDDFTRWQSLGHPCDIDSSGSPIILPPGNIHVDCDPFTVKKHVQISGDVVFNGDVDVTSSGHLDINNSPGDPGTAFFRDGELSKSGSASITFNHTMVYMSKTSFVDLSGGAGSLIWIAPDGDLEPFDDLALWSDSPQDHNWAGQANLQMEGVFFMPLAKVIYTGGSDQKQTDAQWIADRLEAGGNSALVVAPAVGRSLSLDGVQTVLIR